MYLFIIPVILLFVAGGALLAKGMTTVGVALLIAGLVAALIHAAISSALNTILVAALYQYAADKAVPEAFSRSQFEGAFESKPQTA